MNFQNNLNEFKFNLETLDLLKNENLDNTEIIDTLIEAGFSSELTSLLLTLNRTYLNSVLVRLKLYNKLKKNKDQVINNLKDYENLKPLIQKLFNESENFMEIVSDNNSNEHLDVVEKLEKLEEQGDQNKDHQEIQEYEEEEDNFYENFFLECLESSEDKKDTVKSKEVYNVFKKWYSKKYSSNVPSKTELKNFLNTKLGKSVKSSWNSVKLVV